jgi:hypothetical protein
MAVCKPNPHIAGNRKAALVGSVRRNSGPLINSNMFHAVETLLRLGYGSRLAHGVFEALRSDGKRVIAKFPFMSCYTARHPEYGALLDG